MRGRRPDGRLIAVAAVAAIATMTAATRKAAAQADCSTVGPNVLYISGTTDVKPLLSRIAPKLATAMGDDRITIVYQGVGSCTALDTVLNPTTTLQGMASYWAGPLAPNGTGVESMCTLPAGTKAHLALSDVTIETCTGAPKPDFVGEFSSVVQTFGFVVPPASSQQAITAEEAYLLFKYGAEAGKQAPPWTDPAFIVIRTPAASTQLLIGLASGVKGTMWSPNLTNINMGSSAVVMKVAAENMTGNADKTIGILSTQRYDENRNTLKMLAFQSFKQGCLGAVLPDSTPTALDKRNVRDGHYGIWGYLWAVAPLTAGVPTGAAKRFIDFLSGTTAINGADPIADPAKAGAVPACAMKVKRAYDGAPMERYTPAEPCGCAFEKAATGTTTCEACPAGTCANGGTCRFGYCEK
jgi:hypothetical protein